MTPDPAPPPVKPRTIVRPYQPQDREAVRAICADTGFLGRPIDPVFEDRELFADFWTTYYLTDEPDATWVCEIDGRVCGYLMGCRRPRQYTWRRLWLCAPLALRALWRAFTRYNAASRRFLFWLVFRAGRQTPVTPPNTPHFHFNVLPEARSVAGTRQLVDVFLEFLSRHGQRNVYGQVVATDDRRGERVFARYGFQVLDKKLVTKFENFTGARISLYTIYKDLTANTKLYGLDLHRAKSEPADT